MTRMRYQATFYVGRISRTISNFEAFYKIYEFLEEVCNSVEAIDDILQCLIRYSVILLPVNYSKLALQSK